jgi:hypothetical protein
MQMFKRFDRASLGADLLPERDAAAEPGTVGGVTIKNRDHEWPGDHS